MARQRRYHPFAYTEEGVRLVSHARVAAQPDQVAGELRKLAEEMPWLDAAERDELVPAERIAEIAGQTGTALAAIASALAPPGSPSRVAIGSRFAFTSQAPAHTLVRHEFELRVPGGFLRRAEATVLRALLRRAQAALLRRLRSRVGLESLTAVGDRLAREVLLALRVGGPRTSAELAAELRVSAGRVARALGMLADAGYVAQHDKDNAWTATPDNRPLEFPVNGAGAAVVSLVEQVNERMPTATAESDLRSAGERFGRRLATLGASDVGPSTTLPEAAEQVAAFLSRLGHEIGVESNGDGGVTLRPGSCPMRTAIRDDVRTLPFDLGMWQGMLQTAMPGLAPDAVRVECSGCLDDGQACYVKLTPGTEVTPPVEEAAPRGPAPV
jgi:predicted ArsR family transcriptional regulator